MEEEESEGKNSIKNKKKNKKNKKKKKKGKCCEWVLEVNCSRHDILNKLIKQIN